MSIQIIALLVSSATMCATLLIANNPYSIGLSAVAIGLALYSIRLSAEKL